MSEQNRCPFCDTPGSAHPHPMSHVIIHYTCHERCGCFLINRRQQQMFLADEHQRREAQSDRIRALLRERSDRGDAHPLLVFGDEPLPDFKEGVPIRVADLLLQWPHTVPEKIERSFAQLMQTHVLLILIYLDSLSLYNLNIIK